jgi:gluconolactonase
MANVYRVDGQSGRVEMMVTAANLPGNPNGIAFAPDYKKVYIVTNGIVHSFDLSADNKLSNQKEFSNFMVDGVQCRTDGIRVDVNGNLWCGSNAGRSLGYSGVTVWSPEGRLLGRIRLPETCANLAFGGPKRNRLFMTAAQSLYALYVNTQGASPG